MIEIKGTDYSSPEYDGCGNTTMATLSINGTIIPLCEECIKELTQEIETFNSTVFCYKCKHFIKNPDGFKYAGGCRKKYENKYSKPGDTFPDDAVGVICCVDSMDTCVHAEL